MARWDDVSEAAPELAALARARIEATGLGLLATLRRDGWPRISGIEPWFDDGELWLGMMKDSRKALDLLRDPRLALHNATVDKEVSDGDVKITGRAAAVTDADAVEQVRQALLARTGFDPGTDFHLFRVEVTEVSSIRPGGDHLVIDVWREGEPPRRVERY
jgi:hypothetical protein